MFSFCNVAITTALLSSSDSGTVVSVLPGVEETVALGTSSVTVAAAVPFEVAADIDGRETEALLGVDVAAAAEELWGGCEAKAGMEEFWFLCSSKL